MGEGDVNLPLLKMVVLMLECEINRLHFYQSIDF